MPKYESHETLNRELLTEVVGMNTGEVDAIVEETNAEVQSLPAEEQFLSIQKTNFRNSAARLYIDEFPTDEPWRELFPAELFFQEAFSRPPFLAPHKGKHASYEDGQLIYEHAPISPKRFPDTVFTKLTGIGFNFNKNTLEGMNERYKKLDDLRTIWKNLAPLCTPKLHKKTRRDDTGRLRVVPPKSKELEKVETEKQWPRGALIVSRKPRLEGNGPCRFYSFYNDIYDLLRAHTHTINFYSGRYAKNDLEQKSELDVLAQLKSEITETIWQLQAWKSLSDEQKEKIQTVIKDLADLMSKCTDEYKSSAGSLLEKSHSLKDKRKKQYNPGSTCAQLVGAFNRIIARLESAMGIEATVKKDKASLESIRDNSESKLLAAHSRLSEILADEFFQKHDFDEIAGSQTYVRVNASGVSEKLKPVEKSLNEMNENESLPAPFPKWADAAGSNLRVVRILCDRMSEIGADELQKLNVVNLERLHRVICEYAIRAELALRYQNVQRRLIRILDDILQKPFTLKPNQVYREIDDLHKFLDPHFFREHYAHRDEGMKVVFDDSNFYPVSALLRELKHLLKQWQAEKIFIYKEQALKAGQFDPDAPDQEDFFEELMAREKEVRDNDREFLNKLYETVSAFDFNTVISSVNTDADETVDTILGKFGLKQGQFE